MIKYNLTWFIIVVISSVMLFLPYIFSLIGLSTIGPVTGSLFSTMQGAGIVSGSLMAMAQSFVMSGWAVFLQSLTIIIWCTISVIISVKKLIFNKIYKIFY